MNKPLLFLLGLLFILTESVGQNYPFPQTRTYSFGLMPGNKSGSDAQSAYNTWKSNFVTACSNGRYRVKFDDQSQTVSEGIGYGMLLAAYAGDRTVFDGLWLYYKDFRNSHGVMHWKISGCNSVAAQNGATDAELDAAMALIVAHSQWGSSGSINYQSDAKTLIGAIKAYEVESGSYVLKPGDMFGGSSLTNPSYFSPGYYRMYGEFTGDQTFWNNVASKTYQVINNNLSRNSAAGGLVSDWCTADGSYSSSAGGYFDGGKRYHYDAARTPWRITTDYIWYGTSDAKIYMKKASDFVRIKVGGTKNIKDGYYQNGTAYGSWHNSTFVGAFANAAMGGDDQTHLNSSYSDLVSINDASSYFNQTLKALYLFQLTGNFWKPGSTPNSGGGTTTPTNQAPAVSITSPANNSSFTAGANITISANASDTDGSISKVEFYRGSTKIGEDLNSPYSVSWSNIAAGSYTLTAKAYDNSGASTTSSGVNIAVTQNTVVSQSPYGGTPWKIPGRIETENYDLGGTEVSYLDKSAGNAGSAYRNDDVDVESSADGGYNVGWVAAGEWLEYSVRVEASGKYDFKFRVATINSGRYFHVEMNGQNVTGNISVPNTGGWQTWGTLTVPGISLSAGDQVMRIYMDTDGFNMNYVDVSAVATSGSNSAPSVSVTSPSNNSSFTAGANITISANASDSDGSISKVEFYQGSVKLGEDLSSPYSVSWSNVQEGSYALTAKAYDNAGAVSTSSPVNISVSSATSSNQAPAVSITSPSSGSTYTEGSNISISANASDNDGGISKVEFYHGSTKISQDNKKPYNVSWSNVPAGTYSLTAVAYDTEGLSAVSTPVNITVTGTTSSNTAPVVSISSPSNNSSFAEGANVTISANASDSDGSVSKVEFYQGSVKLGEDATGPYSYTWSNVPAGSYSLTAKAFDNSGAATSSSVVNISVTSSSSGGGSTGSCYSQAVPNATEWVVMNNWGDNGNGSGAGNEDNALKVTHRQWGNYYLWVGSSLNNINLNSGESYTITFDIKDDPNVKLEGVEVGFGSSLNWDAPVLVQPAKAVASGFSSASYTTKSVTVNSAYSGKAHLSFKLIWSGQVPSQVNTYIRNVEVCGSNSGAKLGTLTNSDSYQAYPNPFEGSTSLYISSETDSDLTLTVTDVSGKLVYEAKDYRTNEHIEVGQGFGQGIYFVQARYADRVTVITLIKQ